MKRSELLCWGGVVSVPLLLGAAFVWAGGWLSPGRATQNRMMSIFHASGSTEHGFRRVHAKGVCVTGWFDGSAQIGTLSRAVIFRERHIPVLGRFALGSGNAYQIDDPAMVRSMALRVRPADAPEWRMAMNDPPILPMRDARDALDEFSTQKLDPHTHKADPMRAVAFRENHPWLHQALSIVSHRYVSSGFADDTYYSQNSFLLVNENNVSTPVRWAMIPVTPPKPAGEHAQDPNFLFRELTEALRVHPLQWRLVFTVAGPGDATNDPSQPWSPRDRQIDAGRLTITQAESENGGACTGITFDPLILPPGLAPSDDPILSVRSGAYMRSFYLRSGEPRQPSAISSQLAKGGQQ